MMQHLKGRERVVGRETAYDEKVAFQSVVSNEPNRVGSLLPTMRRRVAACQNHAATPLLSIVKAHCLLSRLHNKQPEELITMRYATQTQRTECHSTVITRTAFVQRVIHQQQVL